MSEIVSYNLSWATQKNVIAGSEWFFVLNCHKHFGKNLKESGLPACTDLAAKGILKNTNFDIMGLQECIKDVTPKFVKYLNLLKNKENSNRKSKREQKFYDYVMTNEGHANIMTVYKNNLVDDSPKIMKKGNLGVGKDLRPFHVLYFPKINLLFANSHFPHGFTIEDYDNAFKMMFSFKLGNRKVNRIVFVGDFNDGYGYLAERGYIDIELNGIGKKSGKKFHLTCNNRKNVESCCFVFFQVTGDYVWDSENSNKLKIVDNFTKSIKEAAENKNKFVGSDHMRVISISNKKL